MSSEFKNAIINIRDAASTSAIVWRNLIPFAQQMMAGCWQLKEAEAGEVSDVATYLYEEIGRWQFDLLEAENVALSVSSIAEVILQTESIKGIDGCLPDYIPPLYSWHAALCLEEGMRIRIDEEGDHLISSNSHGFVTGLASSTLRNSTFPELRIENGFIGWHYWEHWAEQVQTHLLNQNECWNAFASWSYSDRSGMMLSSLERQFKELKIACSQQRKLQVLLKAIQHPLEQEVNISSTFTQRVHPLYLEFLRLSSNAYTAPECVNFYEEE